MLTAMGYSSSNLGVAANYAGLIDGLIIDESDRADQDALEAEGLRVMTTSTLMTCLEDKARLAKETLTFASACRRQEVER